jgi:hypothetical protein
MECKFVVGQKVVCINDKVDDFRLPNRTYLNSLDGLKKGEIYTVREILIDPIHKFPSIKLSEIIRPIISNEGFEVGYHFQRFAPLKEKTSDISIFTEILNKVNDGNHDNDYDFCLDELYETVNK